MAEIIFTRDDEIQAIFVDVTVEERHSDSSEVTDHPIEEGSDASDGKRNTPPMVTLSVMVTNSPIQDVPGGNGSVQAHTIEGGSTSFTRLAQGKKAAERETRTLRRTV